MSTAPKRQPEIRSALHRFVDEANEPELETLSLIAQQLQEGRPPVPASLRPSEEVLEQELRERRERGVTISSEEMRSRVLKHF